MAVRHDVRRDDLLERAADYVLAHGLSDLSIRPLSSALGLSHRTLLYYFGSKESLVLAVLDRIRARDRGKIRQVLGQARSTSPVELFRAAWSYFSAPERIPYIRFLHEVLALGLRDPVFRAWGEQNLDARSDMIAAALAATGLPEARALPAANLITAAVRGLQLHLVTTGDRVATDAAFEELLLGLEARLRN